MMLLALVVTIALAIAAGVGLGSTPILNENLHLNIWFAIPVSGGIIGALLALTQFGVMRAMGRPVRGAVIGLLALSCAVGYVSTEVGIYVSTAIDIEDESGEVHAGVPLRELVTFREYLDVALSSSSYESTRGGGAIEYGRTGTTITWGIDVLGSFIVAFFVLMTMAAKSPFCRRCDAYKKENQRLEMVFDADQAMEALDQIHASVAGCDYAGLLSVLTEASKHEAPLQEEQVIRVSVDERVCPSCNEATLLGMVERSAGGRGDWEEASDLAFRLDSATGETARLPRRGRSISRGAFAEAWQSKKIQQALLGAAGR